MSFWGSIKSFTSHVDHGIHNALREANKEAHTAAKSVSKAVHHVETKAKEATHTVEKAAKTVGHVIDVKVGEATHEVKKAVQNTGRYVDHTVKEGAHVVSKAVKTVEHTASKAAKTVEHTVSNTAKKVQNVARSDAKTITHAVSTATKDVKAEAKKVVTSISHAGYTYKAEQAAKTAYNFSSGVGTALVNNAAFGLPDKLAHQPANANTTAYQVGRVFGDAVSTVAGAVETVEGSGMALGGGAAAVVTAPTGVGALAGGAVAVGGVAVAAHGATQAVNGLKNFGSDISKLHEHLQMASTKGTGEAHGTTGTEGGNQVRNAHLAGSTHPVTGVPFDENGFPVFNSKHDHQLPENLHTAKDPEQFKNANQALQQHVQNHPESASKFTEQQRAQIAKGKQPKGLTWHHHQDPGKLQLVDSNTHRQTGHTGGRNIWGGGSKHR